MSDIEKGSVEHRNASAVVAQRVPGAGIANPGVLGLFSFASTTFILSFYNTGVRNIHTPNVVVGMAIACGGLAQLLAGMWEFPKGNTFGATAFTSYGAFWLSYSAILIPGTGIVASYGGDAKELESALGIYLMTWFIVTVLFLIAALRKNIGFIVLLSFLSITFLVLGAAEFSQNASAHKAGGALGIITAFVAYYIGLAELLAAEKAAIFRPPIGIFKHD